MEIRNVEKTYTIYVWEIRLNSGSYVDVCLRKDLGDTMKSDAGKIEFKWVKPKRRTRIFWREIASISDYQIEQKEAPKLKPRAQDVKQA